SCIAKPVLWKFFILSALNEASKTLGVKCCNVFIAENDDVVGIDIESVRRKIRRTGEHLYYFVHRLRFLDVNLRVGEALEASAKNCAGSFPLRVKVRLQLIFERVRISMGF